MGNKLLAVILGFSLVACATIHANYNNDELTTANYQKRIDELISNTDSLKDFKNENVSSKIGVNDIATLIQADLYFNQADYYNALPLYEKLAYQYKIPKVIYKAIICYEKSGIVNTRPTAANNLITLFIQLAPNTDIARLLKTKQAIYSGKLELAKTTLDKLLINNADDARNCLLFLSSTISIIHGQSSDNESLDLFAKYVVNKYSEYPETYLLVSTIYATTNDVVNLKHNLKYIKNNYSKWQIPLLWSVIILSTNANYKTIVDIISPYVVDNSTPDISMQNIYIGALLASKQLDVANNYLNNQAKINDTPNIQLNLGIIAAINKDYAQATKYLSPLQLSNAEFNNLINIYLGLLADYNMRYKEAVNYYSKVTNNVYLENIANTMLVNDYTRLKDKAKVCAILDKIAQDKNLTGLDRILFKARSYISAYDNDSAYKLLKTNFKLHNKNPDYIYLYASSLAVTHHTKEAINMYNYYIELAPKSEYGYNNLAYVYIEQTSQYKLALKNAKKAASINITDYSVMDTLGWIYYKMGDYVKAYPLINSSYQTTPTYDGAEHLKAVLNALNKPRLADTIIVTNKDLINAQVNKLMADKMLGLLILLQYGLVGMGLGFE